mmetsp:Transcript_54232/g.145192  ORF Transcript_54232/g.145192 Transcript_54232/m.145192 type:complete len:201 (+) Transcript_54232:211-813(+)
MQHARAKVLEHSPNVLLERLEVAYGHLVPGLMHAQAELGGDPAHHVLPGRVQAAPGEVYDLPGRQQPERARDARHEVRKVAPHVEDGQGLQAALPLDDSCEEAEGVRLRVRVGATHRRKARELEALAWLQADELVGDALPHGTDAVDRRHLRVVPRPDVVHSGGELLQGRALGPLELPVLAPLVGREQRELLAPLLFELL